MRDVIAIFWSSIFKNREAEDIPGAPINLDGLSKNQKYNETIHMLALEKNLEKAKSPADILIEKFKTEWKEDISSIYKECIY